MTRRKENLQNTYTCLILNKFLPLAILIIVLLVSHRRTCFSKSDVCFSTWEGTYSVLYFVLFCSKIKLPTKCDDIIIIRFVFFIFIISYRHVTKSDECLIIFSSDVPRRSNYYLIIIINFFNIYVRPAWHFLRRRSFYFVRITYIIKLRRTDFNYTFMITC